ncbi:MAG: HDIG domain-containing protein [Desulfobacterales bacterium]|nr:HDIG domain-containing protein [Desulfobacterales bacterium]
MRRRPARWRCCCFPLIKAGSTVGSTITLRRYADLDQPLLKRLFAEAPGTYQHSMNVAYLAQAAGDAIGANPLLLRIGAYFHDIGKLQQPGGYNENQLNGVNLHDTLDPYESIGIITGHIMHGLRIAREARPARGSHRFDSAAPWDPGDRLFLPQSREAQARRQRARRRLPLHRPQAPKHRSGGADGCRCGRGRLAVAGVAGPRKLRKARPRFIVVNAHRGQPVQRMRARYPRHRCHHPHPGGCARGRLPRTGGLPLAATPRPWGERGKVDVHSNFQLARLLMK